MCVGVCNCCSNTCTWIKKKIESCCRAICWCPKKTCECISSCCSDCCNAFWNCKCFEYLSQCIQSKFQRPYSFCAFMSSFLTILPSLLMLIAVIKTYDYVCSQSMTKTSFIVQGSCNLLNFFFCSYLVLRYGKKYSEQQQIEQQEAEDSSALQRLAKVILSDFFSCFYLLAFIFFFAWVAVGHNAYANESATSLCFLANDGFMKHIMMMNLICMDIYLIVTGTLFIFSILVSGCKEGTCTCHEICRCLVFCTTYGWIDIGRRTSPIPIPVLRTQHTDQQKQTRTNNNNNSWMAKSSNFLAGIGIAQHQQPQQQYQQQGKGQNKYQNNVDVPPPPPAVADNRREAHPRQQNLQQNFNNPYMNQNIFQQNNQMQNFNILDNSNYSNNQQQFLGQHRANYGEDGL